MPALPFCSDQLKHKIIYAVTEHKIKLFPFSKQKNFDVLEMKVKNFVPKLIDRVDIIKSQHLLRPDVDCVF